MRVSKSSTVRGARYAAALVLVFLAAGVIWANPAPEAPASPGIAAGQQQFDYVGSTTCKPCHTPQFVTWEKTTMAKAFEVLRPGERVDAKLDADLDPDADYTTDPECLRCHTVGYGEPTGFTSIEETPDLAGVGCETCHGAGSGYVPDNVMGNNNKSHSFAEVFSKGLIYPVSEESCRRCHNEESPFNEDLDPDYELEYSEQVLTEHTHAHLKFEYNHGPLPDGVIFQR